MQGFVNANGIDRQRGSILDRLSVLGDSIRCRLLHLLEGRELTVSELCAVLQLPQSTVSRHLKVLGDGDWVSNRQEGTSRIYSLRRDALDSTALRLWEIVREEFTAGATADQDLRRLDDHLARRRTRSQEFFASAAGRWAQLREEMFGRRFDLQALLGLLDPSWVVGDLGCGTGQVAANLSPFVRQVIALDESDAMLDAARERLGKTENVELRQGRLEELPVATGELDVAIAFLVLHYLAEPQRALREAARTLRPGGHLLIVDMRPHDHDEYRQQMGHVWLGFGERQLSSWLQEAGFESIRFSELPTDAAATGPSLFTATAIGDQEKQGDSDTKQSTN